MKPETLIFLPLFSFFAVFRNQQDRQPDLRLSAYLAVLTYVSTETLSFLFA